MDTTQQRISARGGDRTSVEALRSSFLNHLTRTVGRLLDVSTDTERYHALAHVVRDQVMDDWIHTIQSYRERDVRVVCYLSAEFLLGPHLMNDLLNLGLTESCDQALQSLGLSLHALAEQEPEPGLGNGGLGRLAACYMDSMSTLGVPVIGYGLRYEFGIFRQELRDGWQVEHSDKWLQFGNPWEIPVSDASCRVMFGGRTENFTDESGNVCWRWLPDHTVMGVPYDTPVPGFRNSVVNRLRLWKAEAVDSFDFAAFNTGDYMGAVRSKIESETISKVLYPNDETEGGKRLRLMQQYFFTSCSLQDMIRLHLLQRPSVRDFETKWTVQLNDTHPSIGIAELMRLLIDVHGLEWDEAWRITSNTFGYTNHTLLPEALERWPLHLFADLLPRHLQLIYEMNAKFLKEMQERFPDDPARLARMSIIGEDGGKTVRMANLAVVGSKAVNGVAKLHTELLEEDTLHDFYEAFPERFSNKTNGVTPRRWLMLSNPSLAALLDQSIGQGWHTDLNELRGLERFLSDPSFLEQWRKRQEQAKNHLSNYVQRTMKITLDPTSMFDAQVKRIHEYKRQHLNALHILALYCQIKSGAVKDATPRTFLFGGKAAPGYQMAKLIIKLVCTVGELVNSDPVTRDVLRVIFVPDYSVSLGQRIYPTADLSEQISTAGKEASGTGCMKFMMNGAIAIGTLDGANIEIRDAVGQENFFLFGLTAPEIAKMKQDGYRPRDFYERDPLLREVLDGLGNGTLSKGDRQLFQPLLDELLNRDAYMVLADFRAYIEAQANAGSAFQNAAHWTRMSVLNTARSGVFSSDRAIRQYCKEIWNVPISG
ncbi:MAG: glycogen/starch/alpha-glucan phosphorylase [Janthinobacterium lividum]